MISGQVRREETPGARIDRIAGRKFQIQAKDFSSVDQAVPIPVIYGTVKTAGIHFMPIFGFVAEPLTQDISK